MRIDPELAALLTALAGGVAIGLPGLQRAVRSRRVAARRCVVCARTIVFGERTCDCPPDEA